MTPRANAAHALLRGDIISRALAMCLLYWLGVKIGLLFLVDSLSILWPANGLALGLILASRGRSWPALFGGMALGYLLGVHGQTAQPLPIRAGLFAANFLEVFPAAFLLRQRLGPENKGNFANHVLFFILLGVMAGPALGSLLAASVTAYGLGAPFSQDLWLAWAMGHSASILTFAPPIFLLANARRMWRRRAWMPAINRFLSGEALAYFVLFWGFCYVVSGPPLGNHVLHSGLIYIAFPLVIWGSLRFPPAFLAIIMSAMVLIMTLYTWLGIGPFATSSTNLHSDIFHLHSFIISLGSTGYLLGSLSRQQQRHLAALQAARAKALELAHFDPLTGLARRHFFLARLEDALKQAKRRHEMVGLLMIDLDLFKPVNDTYGHSVGDAVLCELASILRAHVREVDTVARLGGDEFAIIFDGIKSVEDVSHPVNRILRAVAEPISIGDVEVRIGVSVGVAFFPADAHTAEDLAKAADRQLYEAKKCGRGCCKMSQLGEEPGTCRLLGDNSGIVVN